MNSIVEGMLLVVLSVGTTLFVLGSLLLYISHKVSQEEKQSRKDSLVEERRLRRNRLRRVARAKARIAKKNAINRFSKIKR